MCHFRTGAHHSSDEDNVGFETDDPHTDTTWPFVRADVEKMTAALTGAQRDRVLRGNAIQMLDLDLERA